jgi:hypothetical protein
MSDGGNVVTQVTRAEHIGPDDTGDNINAKRVAPYYWDGTNWQRQGAGLVPSSYDYLSYTSNTTTDVYEYYQGGSGGTLIATITVTWTDSTKTVLSSVART